MKRYSLFTYWAIITEMHCPRLLSSVFDISYASITYVEIWNRKFWQPIIWVSQDTKILYTDCIKKHLTFYVISINIFQLHKSYVYVYIHRRWAQTARQFYVYILHVNIWKDIQLQGQCLYYMFNVKIQRGSMF